MSMQSRPDIPVHIEHVAPTRSRWATSRLSMFVLIAGILAFIQIFNTSHVIKSMNSLYTILPADMTFTFSDTGNTEKSDAGEKVTVIAPEFVTCAVSTTCGSVFLNGQRCSTSNAPQTKFTGQYICYDSNGCDLGHQINAIALLSARFGDQFRVLDPVVVSTVNSENGEIRIQEISYDSFLAPDTNITIPRKSMHSLCSRLINNFKPEDDENARLSFAVNQHWYLPTVMIPFFDSFLQNTTCPNSNFPSIQHSLVEYSPNPNDDLGMTRILQCSGNITYTESNGLTPCDQPQVTLMNAVEATHNYQSIAQKLICNARYFAQYPFQFAHPNIFVQRLIFTEMLRTGQISVVYDNKMKKRIVPLTRNETCRRCVGGCGCMTIPGFSWACDPFRKFTGKYVCYDSSHTGCGLGHQFNGIATLWKVYGDKLRVIDPIISAHRHPEYDGASFSTFLKDDFLIPRDEKIFEKCSYIDNGYDMGTNGAHENPQIFKDFIDAKVLPCPDIPLIPHAVALKIRSTDMDENENATKAHVQLYCDALQLNFSNYTNAIVMTDGPELKCEGFNVTHFEYMDKQVHYGSAAQQLLCGIQYIAKYPVIITRVGSSLLPIIIAERMRAGNSRTIFHVNRRIWRDF